MRYSSAPSEESFELWINVDNGESERESECDARERPGLLCSAPSLAAVRPWRPVPPSAGWLHRLLAGVEETATA